MTQNDAERLEVLEQLESGEIDFDQAMSELNGAPQASSAGGTTSSTAATRRWGYWWLLPFYFGILGMGLGIIVANQGGWYWLLATPLLLGGAALTILALASKRSPWLHVRFHNPERAWPRTIGISFPVPFRFAAWALRTFGPFVPNLDEQAMAELLMAFELGRLMDEPLHIELNDPDSATRVEVYLG